MCGGVKDRRWEGQDRDAAELVGWELGTGNRGALRGAQASQGGRQAQQAAAGRGRAQQAQRKAPKDTGLTLGEEKDVESENLVEGKTLDRCLWALKLVQSLRTSLTSLVDMAP